MLHTPTRRRRIVNTCLLLVAIVLTWVSLKVVNISLADASEWSGWMLFTCVAILLFYGIRKRLSTLPIGRVALWLQAHIYIGVLCLFVFCLHIEWQLPSGWFETCLAISLVGTILTGFIGLYWSRTLPTMLTRLGDEVLYERIPAFAVVLRDAAEETVYEAVDQTGSSALADFYKSFGHKVFSKPNFHWSRLYKAYTPLHKIERELTAAKKLMAKDEAESAQKMLGLIHKKDQLDAHFTFQGALKHWLFVHLAFSLAMIPLVLLHIVLVYSFGLS